MYPKAKKVIYTARYSLRVTNEKTLKHTVLSILASQKNFLYYPFRFTILL